MVIGNGVEIIGALAFYDCSSLTSVTIGNNVKTIGHRSFWGCISLTSIKIPDSVTSLGACAFDHCSSLTSVVIGSSLRSIDDSAFYKCTGLTSITIPNNITTIGDYAFHGCTSLTSVFIPNSVSKIGMNCFEGCNGLKIVTLGSGLKILGSSAYANCPELTDVYCYAETVPSMINVYTYIPCIDAFQGSYIEYAILHVPESSITAYKATEPWKGFKDIVKIMPTFTLTYMVDGEVYISYQVEEGVSIIPEEEPTKDGYTFSGWNGIPETMPARDVTIVGTFVINKYKLTYIIDGEEYKSYDIEYNSAITPEEEPTKDGYTFSGWGEIPETMPANDVTITGTFTINKYKLTYIVDGEEYKLFEIEYNSTITPEAEPTKDGYTFSGWNEIPETMPANDVTVTGSFTINKYKLTYIVDGEEYKSFEIEYNSTITPEAEPTKDGYTFSGWSEIPETMPAHDVTITGSFERVYSGGDVANLIDLLLFGNVDDDDIALYDMNGDGELNIGDLILIMRAAQNNSRNRGAVNRATAKNQSVEFATDIVTMKPGETSALNISLSSSISGIYGIQFEVNLPEGFSLEKGSNDKIYEMLANQVDDITCNDRDLGNGTYRFFIYSSTLQELKGGSLMSLNLKADADKTLGNYSVSISNVAMSDYDGHVTKEEGSSVGGKVTNTFTLLYQVDGEDYKSYEIEYGESITPEAEPTKEGYTFSGWSEIPETMPAEDVIVKGTFTVNQYILTYVVDGEVYKEYSYDYGSAITPEAEPTKEGYTFSGWSEIPETMPAKEVYVVGSFTINKYKITYVIDGEVYLTEEVEYGSRITPPTPSDHEGYDFAWDDYPDTMPAHDITINGTYTATGIEAILASEPDVKIYTVSGKPLNKVQKGVNILRYKDGRTRKIVVK